MGFTYFRIQTPIPIWKLSVGKMPLEEPMSLKWSIEIYISNIGLSPVLVDRRPFESSISLYIGECDKLTAWLMIV